MKIGKGDKQVAVRIVLQSDEHGREFFDHYVTPKQMAAALRRLTRQAIKAAENDGVSRIVGVAIVPKSEFGMSGSYGHDMPQDEAITG